MLGRLKKYGQSEKQRGNARAMKRTALERDAFLDKIADAICRRGLRVPALIALDVGGPLAFLGGQLLWISQPMLTLLMPGQMVSQAAQILEEPESVAALIARLEAREV
jgi:hypothetical protein